MSRASAKKKRRRRRKPHAFDVRIGFGDPNGRRSKVWRIWVLPNKADVYVSPGELRDAKISLHDPERSLGGLPWRFAYTAEYAAAAGGSLPPTGDRALLQWGPVGELGPNAVPMMQVIVPGPELREPLDEGPVETPDVVWFPQPGANEFGFLTLFTVPTDGDAIWSAPGGNRRSWSHNLPNGRTLIVMAAITTGSEGLEHVYQRERADAPQKVLAAIESGNAPFVDDGVNTLVCLSPLPEIGRYRALLELHVASFAVLKPPGGAGDVRDLPA